MLTVGDWHIAEIIATGIEILGVFAIGIGVIVSLIATVRARLADPGVNAYRAFSRGMSRWLLWGLELLIAADVITTVTLELDLEGVAALGLLVIVRTFLAWSIVLEEEGHWPWQHPARQAADD